MLAGVSRLSIRYIFLRNSILVNPPLNIAFRRSIAATATFFVAGIATTRVLYGNTLPTIGPTDWSAGPYIRAFLALQAVPLAISTLLWLFVRPHISLIALTLTLTPAQSPVSPAVEESKSAPPDELSPLNSTTPHLSRIQHTLRIPASLTTAFQFAVALRLSNLVSPSKVTSFLLTPFDPAFDPSLAFLAVGALPLSILLYRYVRPKEERPRLAGEWNVPKSGVVDWRLVFGALVFGIGWGVSGICRKSLAHLLFGE
jgi:uncharacterized protein